MPHESTVEHDNTYQLEDGDTSIGLRQRPDNFKFGSPSKVPKPQSVPHLHADMPSKVTHFHDEDDSDDDSNSASSDKSM